MWKFGTDIPRIKKCNDFNFHDNDCEIYNSDEENNSVQLRTTQKNTECAEAKSLKQSKYRWGCFVTRVGIKQAANKYLVGTSNVILTPHAWYLIIENYWLDRIDH